MNKKFQLILEAEGLGDWTVGKGEAYCWNSLKTIKVPERAQLQSFLHEVAHALTPEPEGPWQNHYHGPKWAATYGRLVNRYMTLKNIREWKTFLSDKTGLRAKTPAFILQAIASRREPVETENIGKYYGGKWFSIYGGLVNKHMTARLS